MSDRLLENAGSGTQSPPRQWTGAAGFLGCWGTWGGATIMVKCRFSKADPWLTPRYFTGVTANELARVEFPAGEVMAEVVGGDGTTSLTVELR